MRYECPKGYEIKIVKSLKTWQASLLGVSVCVVISAISVALTCYWERKYKDTNSQPQGLGKALK